MELRLSRIKMRKIKPSTWKLINFLAWRFIPRPLSASISSIPPPRGKSFAILVSEDVEDGASPLKMKLTMQGLTGHLYGQVSLSGCPNITAYFSAVCLTVFWGSKRAVLLLDQWSSLTQGLRSSAKLTAWALQLNLGLPTHQSCATGASWNWPKWKWEISRTECPQLDRLLLPGTSLPLWISS